MPSGVSSNVEPVHVKTAYLHERFDVAVAVRNGQVPGMAADDDDIAIGFGGKNCASTQMHRMSNPNQSSAAKTHLPK
jgi:hypothetical protein